MTRTVIRNKVVHTLFVVFMQTYATTWSGFLAGLIPLLRTHPNTSTQMLNLRFVDFFLRFLHELGSEVADTLLRSVETVCSLLTHAD